METNNAIQLTLSKDFNVPVARLYQAWITPDDLKQWWRPMGNILQHATTPPKQDGQIEYVFANEQGAHSFTITGVYKEVQEEKKLVYTWNWQIPAATVGDSAFLLTIEFSAAASGSRINVTQENFTDEEAVHPHQDGWEKALTDLQQFLSQQAS